MENKWIITKIQALEFPCFWVLSSLCTPFSPCDSLRFLRCFSTICVPERGKRLSCRTMGKRGVSRIPPSHWRISMFNKFSWLWIPLNYLPQPYLSLTSSSIVQRWYMLWYFPNISLCRSEPQILPPGQEEDSRDWQWWTVIDSIEERSLPNCPLSLCLATMVHRGLEDRRRCDRLGGVPGLNS